MDGKNVGSVYADLLTIVCEGDCLFAAVDCQSYIYPAVESEFLAERVDLVVNDKIRESRVIFGDAVHQVYGLVPVSEYTEHDAEYILTAVP